MIRDLKLEMGRLGISEDEVPSIVAAALGNQTPVSSDQADSGAERASTSAQAAVDDSSFAASFDTDLKKNDASISDDGILSDAPAHTEDGGIAMDFSLFEEASGTAAAASAAAPAMASTAAAAAASHGGPACGAEPAAVSEQGREDEPAWDMLDLFDDDSLQLESLETQENSGAKAAQPTAQPITPWGPDPGAASSSGRPKAGSKSKGKGKDAAALQREQQRLPKALLQQHCLKMSWAQPRFEKLPDSGEGNFRSVPLR